MQVLLDTHTFLWFTAGDSRISELAREITASAENDRFVSIVSCWEIAIKVSNGRLDVGFSLHRLFHERLEGEGLVLLGITRSHLLELPNLVHAHKDPFDRLLVAQAKVEDLVLLSNDETLDAYGVQRVW